MFDDPLCLNKILRGTEYAIATQNKYLIVKALLIKDLCLCVYLQSKFKVFFYQKFTLSRAVRADANPQSPLFKACRCLLCGLRRKLLGPIL